MAEPVIDSHVHLFDRENFHYPWIAGNERLDRDRGLDDLDLGDSGVTGFVFVEAGALPEDALPEARWAAGHRAVRGTVAAVAIEELDAADRLDAARAVRGVVGVRRSLQDEPDDLLSSAALARGLRAVAAAGLTFDATARAHQLPAVATLLQRAPGLRLVLDHLGKPAVGLPDSLPVWREHLAAIAEHPAAMVKLSGLYAECPPGIADLDAAVRPWLETAVEVFGPGRCMVGSDWPVSTDGEQYAQWFRLVLDGLGLTPAERTAVASGAATKFYGLT